MRIKLIRHEVDKDMVEMWCYEGAGGLMLMAVMHIDCFSGKIAHFLYQENKIDLVLDEPEPKETTSKAF